VNSGGTKLSGEWASEVRREIILGGERKKADGRGSVQEARKKVIRLRKTV